ncbi:MAG: LamG domain-containing protein [Blastococcus sp.]
MQIADGSLVAAGRASTVPDYTSGQVVHYTFRNVVGTTVPDISGTGNDGRLFNFTTPPPTDVGSDGSRTALVFQRALKQRLGVGTTNHTSPSPSLQVSRFTIASWIKITENDTTQQNWEIAEKALSYWFNVRNGNDSTVNHSDSTDPHYVLRCGGRFAGGQFMEVTGSTVVPHGSGNTTWAHAVCTYNGSALKIYLNGVVEASKIINLPLDRNTGALVVGGNDKTQWAPDYFHNWWQGSIDDFRLYNRALTAAQVSALYAATG